MPPERAQACSRKPKKIMPGKVQHGQAQQADARRCAAKPLNVHSSAYWAVLAAAAAACLKRGRCAALPSQVPDDPCYTAMNHLCHHDKKRNNVLIS